MKGRVANPRHPVSRWRVKKIAQYLALRGVRASFIKRHRPLINEQSLFTLDTACNYVLILGGKIHVDSRILVRCACSINNGDTRASTYRFEVGRARARGAISLHSRMFQCIIRCAWCTREPPASPRRVGASYSTLIDELRFRYRIAHRRSFCITYITHRVLARIFQATLSASQRPRPNLIMNSGGAPPRRFACATFTGSAWLIIKIPDGSLRNDRQWPLLCGS